MRLFSLKMHTDRQTTANASRASASKFPGQFYDKKIALIECFSELQIDCKRDYLDRMERMNRMGCKIQNTNSAASPHLYSSAFHPLHPVHPVQIKSRIEILRIKISSVLAIEE